MLLNILNEAREGPKNAHFVVLRAPGNSKQTPQNQRVGGVLAVERKHGDKSRARGGTSQKRNSRTGYVFCFALLAFYSKSTSVHAAAPRKKRCCFNPIHVLLTY